MLFTENHQRILDALDIHLNEHLAYTDSDIEQFLYLASKKYPPENDTFSMAIYAWKHANDSHIVDDCLKDIQQVQVWEVPQNLQMELL